MEASTIIKGVSGLKVEELVSLLQKQGVRLVEFIYVDYTGIARGKTIFLEQLASRLVDGMGITRAMPASTMRDEIVEIAGFDAIGEFRLVPDLSSVRVLPQTPWVATVMCDYHTQDGQPLDFDGRVVLQKQIQVLAKLGLTAKMSYENEFSLYRRDEAQKLVPDRPRICFSTESMEDAYEFLPDLIDALERVGIEPLAYYPEAGAGQHELPVKPKDALEAADDLIRFKRIVKSVVKKHGLYATFAPKPNLDQAGNGAHLHVSLWNEAGENVLYDADDELNLSQLGYFFVGGILKHSAALLAFSCASLNSYERLKPSHWSSAYAAFGKDNREACVRIPSTFASNRAQSLNIELKASDACANPYLACSALLAAGLDGIKKQIMPTQLLNCDPALLSSSKRAALDVTRLPENFAAALAALEKDELFKEMLGPVGLAMYLKVKRQDLAFFADKTPTQIAQYYRDLY